MEAIMDPVMNWATCEGVQWALTHVGHPSAQHRLHLIGAGFVVAWDQNGELVGGLHSDLYFPYGPEVHVTNWTEIDTPDEFFGDWDTQMQLFEIERGWAGFPPQDDDTPDDSIHSFVCMLKGRRILFNELPEDLQGVVQDHLRWRSTHSSYREELSQATVSEFRAAVEARSKPQPPAEIPF